SSEQRELVRRERALHVHRAAPGRPCRSRELAAGEPPSSSGARAGRAPSAAFRAARRTPATPPRSRLRRVVRRLERSRAREPIARRPLELRHVLEQAAARATGELADGARDREVLALRLDD